MDIFYGWRGLVRLNIFISYRLRNKFLQLMLISLDSASCELHRYSRQMCGRVKIPKLTSAPGYFRLFIVSTDASRGQLVVTGDSARIQDETTQSSPWFFYVLGIQHRHTGPRFKVSFERQLVIFSWPAGVFEATTCSDPKHCVHESYALPSELIDRLTRTQEST